MPGDVDFKSSVGFFINDILIPGKVHEAVIVAENGLRFSIKDGNSGFVHVFCYDIF